MSNPLYLADPDAGPLDAQVMALAQRLHETGWVEEAELIAGYMALLRETPRHAVGEGLGELHDALDGMADAAGAVAEIIRRCFPDPHAMLRA
jgi:hypothetical protein